MTLQTEVKDALSQYGKAFEDFKSESDKGRQADQETLEKVSKTLDETRDQIDRIETAFKRPHLGAMGGGDQAEQERKDATEFFQIQSKSDEPIEITDQQLDEFGTYKKAFDSYIRRSADQHGAGLKPDEQKALSIGSDTSGGYLVTPTISTQMTRTIFETSPMRPICRVVSIGTDSFREPVDKDEPDAIWVGEIQSRAETATPDLAQLEIFARELSAMPKATQNLLDDSGINVETWLSEKLSDKFSRAENTAFVNGDGALKPRGILNHDTVADASWTWGKLGFIVSGSAAALGVDAFLDLVGALKSGYLTNARWLMNRVTLTALRKFKDGNGAYIWQPGLQQGQPDLLLGFPIVRAEDMPDVSAGSFPVAFGDFQRGYTIVDRHGVRILRDPYTSKPFVKFYTTKRVGGDVANFEAIKLMKIST